MTQVNIIVREGKAIYKPRHASGFPTESHTRASKLSAGIGNTCDRAGSCDSDNRDRAGQNITIVFFILLSCDQSHCLITISQSHLPARNGRARRTMTVVPLKGQVSTASRSGQGREAPTGQSGHARPHRGELAVSIVPRPRH